MRTHRFKIKHGELNIRLVLLVFCSFLTACQQVPEHSEQLTNTALEQIPAPPIVDNQKEQPEINLAKIDSPSPIPKTVVHPSPVMDNTKTLSQNAYAWLTTYNQAMAVSQQISVPNGYERLAVEEGSFGEWLRGLPLEAAGTKVLLYNGETKSYQDGAYRVLNIDIGERDLQQCADAVMRLKAEYHYSQKDYEQIHFNYTSGDNIRFSDWSKGKKPQVKGSKVSFSSASGSTDTSYKNFKKYLVSVYNYAGTSSLSKELTSKKVADIVPGDVFIWGGFPGHAIIVLDVAKHQQTGKKIFLVAQNYMPAQSIHILQNFNDNKLSPWYSEDFGAQLETPEWTFDRDALKRF